MKPAPDPYGEWDGAYVLGALSADERRDFERHLEGCPACSRAVAELAGLPDLLAGAPSGQGLRLDHGGENTAPAFAPAPVPAGMPEDVGSIPAATLPRLLASARAQRRRTRALVTGGLVLVAAAAASVALLLPGWLDTVERGTEPTVTLAQVVPSPLSAAVHFTDESWGTRIEASCSYARTGTSTTAQPYALYVTDRAGGSEVVATWMAGPGTTVAPVGTTRFEEEDIASVDIRWLPSGKVLLESRMSP